MAEKIDSLISPDDIPEIRPTIYEDMKALAYLAQKPQNPFTPDAVTGIRGVFLSAESYTNPFHDEFKHYIAVGEKPEDIEITFRSVQDATKKSRYTSNLNVGPVFERAVEWFSLDESSAGFKRRLKIHEETHYMQYVRYKATEIDDVLNNVSIIENPNYWEIALAKSEADVFLEAQAIIESVAADGESPEEQLAFAVADLSTALSGFTPAEHTQESYFDAFYDGIKNHRVQTSGYFLPHNMARALLLTGDFSLMDKIESGEVSKEDFLQMVGDGFERFFKDPDKFVKDLVGHKRAIRIDVDQRLYSATQKFYGLAEPAIKF